MQIETAQLFVLITMTLGITMRESQDLSGQRQAKVSRNVTIMSEWKTAEEPGLDLVVSEINPHERRRKLVHLTPKGEELAERLDELSTVGRAGFSKHWARS